MPVITALPWTVPPSVTSISWYARLSTFKDRINTPAMMVILVLKFITVQSPWYMFFNELVRLVWGPEGIEVGLPDFLNQSVTVFTVPLPMYRIVVIVVGLLVAALIYLLVAKTRTGMLIRAGASNREMVGALGVDIKLIFTLVFGLGAALAALAGALAGPIFAVTIGMGEHILIQVLVVIVIGGIGSIRGAFVGAILIGVIDVLGRSFLDSLFKLFLPVNTAETAAPAVASMLIYILMAAVLFFRPQGLFPARTG